MYLQKIVGAPAILYFKFCQSVGHDEKYCRAYQLLQEKKDDTYLMKNDEHMQDEIPQAQYPQLGGVVFFEA